MPNGRKARARVLQRASTGPQLRAGVARNWVEVARRHLLRCGRGVPCLWLHMCETSMIFDL
jgi:hypothetical protein